MNLPRLLPQPEDWLRNNPSRAKRILDWILHDLEAAEVAEDYRDPRGRTVYVSRHNDSVEVSWSMKASGRIIIVMIRDVVDPG